MGWLGHDQVGLQGWWLAGSEVRKGNRRAGSTWSLVNVSQGKRIACLVLPGLKVHGLARTDAQKDPQNFQISYLLRKSWIEAGAALLNKCKVEPRGEGDCLQMGRDAGGKVGADGAAGSVSVGSWDGCMLPYIETGNGLNELRAGVKIGVGGAPVPGPKAGVDGELHEVGEPCLAG